MELRLNLQLADGYRSPSQRARVLTEGWYLSQMYCPTCPSNRVRATRDNTRVVDFVCPGCGAEFQLKAKAGQLGRKLRDAAWAPMMERIAANRSPHFAFLSYDKTAWHVTGLLLVPGHFITPQVIERCKPLSKSARRADWVGCNVLADAIPPDGRLQVIRGGRVELPPSRVRTEWKRFDWLADCKAELRGWTADVLRCVRAIGRRQFTLNEMYEFEEELSARHPDNRNVRPKIRQQLQVLRDHGLLRFVRPGKYELNE